MKISKININKFRAFRNQEFKVGAQITAIAGQNGTQKSTLLGMIQEPIGATNTSTLVFSDDWQMPVLARLSPC